MHWGAILILVGIAIELLGVLLLSVEAIGLQRVYRIFERTSSVHTFLLSPHPTNTFLSPPRFIAAFMAIVGGVALFYLNRYFPELVGAKWLLVTAIAAGALAVILLYLVFGTLGAFAKFLSFLAASTEHRTAGVIGFCILAVGLTLQFAGTILDSLYRV